MSFFTLKNGTLPLIWNRSEVLWRWMWDFSQLWAFLQICPFGFFLPKQNVGFIWVTFFYSWYSVHMDVLVNGMLRLRIKIPSPPTVIRLFLLLGQLCTVIQTGFFTEDGQQNPVTEKWPLLPFHFLSFSWWKDWSSGESGETSLLPRHEANVQALIFLPHKGSPCLQQSVL